MLFAIADQRNLPTDPESLAEILSEQGIPAQFTQNGNVCADVQTSSELISMSIALDAVVEACVDVEGRDVSSWIRIRDRPEESDLPEPKPCPFCGEPARIMLAPEDWIQCTGCGAMSEFSASPENAVRKWNKRMP